MLIFIAAFAGALSTAGLVAVFTKIILDRKYLKR